MEQKHPLQREYRHFLESLKEQSRLRPGSLEVYERDLALLLDLYPDPQSTQALKKHLAGLAPATHQRKLTIWRTFLKTCSPKWQESISQFPSPRLRQKAPTFLTEKEVFLLEVACYKSKDQLRDRMLVGFALHLGLRLSEIIGLRIRDIEGAWVRIVRKGDKEQRLPFPESLRVIWQQWLGERRQDRPEDFVFAGRKLDSPMTSRSVQLLLKTIVKRAGIQKRISPHSLRHTFATTLASRGANLVALKELLGHENLSTTERYMHVTPEHLRDTLSLLNKPNPEKF